MDQKIKFDFDAANPYPKAGAYFVEDLPMDTFIGIYPGRPRFREEVLDKGGVKNPYIIPARTDDTVIDPTDSSGKPSPWPWPGLPWFPVDTTLAEARHHLSSAFATPDGLPANTYGVWSLEDEYTLELFTVREVKANEEMIFCKPATAFFWGVPLNIEGFPS